jgi:hypothetical protein
MASLRLRLEPWLEAELEGMARRENRRSISDLCVALIKESVGNRRRADTAVSRLVEILKMPSEPAQ